MSRLILEKQGTSGKKLREQGNTSQFFKGTREQGPPPPPPPHWETLNTIMVILNDARITSKHRLLRLSLINVSNVKVF